LRADLKTFRRREQLLKIPVDNSEHFTTWPPDTRINEHKFGSLCSPRHAHGRQKPAFEHQQARKIGHFCSPMWDPFPQYKIQTLTHQRLTPTE
jgi:hypothetical protein